MPKISRIDKLMKIYQDNETQVFISCPILCLSDFQEPFFKVIDLNDNFKFLTYCGKDQRKNLNKNGVVVELKVKEGIQGLYRIYLMDKDKEIDLKQLFVTDEQKTIGEHNGYNLDPRNYVEQFNKNFLDKKPVIELLNKIINFLVNRSKK